MNTGGDWKVDEWFSAEREATRWNDLYASDRPRPEEDAFRRRRDHALAFVASRLEPGSRVLDLGCGAGALLVELIKAGFKGAGVDYAPDMLAFARRRLSESAVDSGILLRADASCLPFPDDSFDGVVCLGVISYQEEYSGVLREVRRVLAPGGSALITFRNVLHPIFSDPWEAAKALGRYALRGERPHAVGMGRPLHPSAVRLQIEQAGLNVDDFRGIGLGPPRIAGRPLLGDRTAIRVDRALSRGLSRVGLRGAGAWAADVAIFECRKQEQPLIEAIVPA